MCIFISAIMNGIVNGIVNGIADVTSAPKANHRPANR